MQLGVRAWVRIAALVALPVASGLALATWYGMRGNKGEGRGRAAFWAGTTFDVGYVLVRLVVGHLGLSLAGRLGGPMGKPLW